MENVVNKETERTLDAGVENAAATDELNDVITVYGISGIENIKTRECVKSYIDEGASVLLTLDINGRVYTVRVLKEHPYVGIMVNGHKEGA